ncbi:MAG: hypothetical protein Q9216_004523 [Gyalolechia sp. 2 TL-2023]
MASENVLRLPRTDSPGDYILLNTSSNGSSPLDLKLLATEGLEPYVKSLKHLRISKYRARTNHLTEPQWEHLLRSILLQERTSSANQNAQAEDITKDLELVASVADSKLTITFRKSISGIHQKLGEVSLPKDVNAEINTLDWAHTAIIRADALQTEAHNLQQRLKEQTQTVKQINQQLEDLIQAKKDHEELLLQKCANLLNEKKAKIRDQQRLLATVQVDPKKLKEVQNARQTSGPRHPNASRGGKRKASAPAASSDEEVDGFEDHAVKIEEQGEEQPDSEQVTPQHSDLDETDDEVDSADLDAVPAPPAAKGKVTETVKVNGGLKKRGGIGEEEGDIELPPRRDLPFMKDKDVAKPASSNETKEQDTKMGGDDDDETDDEL